jgi:hypothetical protein
MRMRGPLPVRTYHTVRPCCVTCPCRCGGRGFRRRGTFGYQRRECHEDDPTSGCVGNRYGMTQQAVACDWNKEVSNAPIVVAYPCGGSNCATQDPSDAPVAVPVAPKTADAPVEPDLRPLRVADPCGAGSGCRGDLSHSRPRLTASQPPGGGTSAPVSTVANLLGRTYECAELHPLVLAIRRPFRAECNSITDQLSQSPCANNGRRNARSP